MMLRRLLSAFGIYCCSTGLWLISAARRTKAIRRDLQKRSIAHLNRLQCVCKLQHRKGESSSQTATIVILSVHLGWKGPSLNTQYRMKTRKEKQNRNRMRSWLTFIALRRLQIRNRRATRSPCDHLKAKTTTKIQKTCATIAIALRLPRKRSDWKVSRNRFGCGSFSFIFSGWQWFCVRRAHWWNRWRIWRKVVVDNRQLRSPHCSHCRLSSPKKRRNNFFDFGARVPLYDLIQCEIYCDEPFKQPIHGRQPTFNSSFSNISWSGRPLSAIFQWSNHASICWLVLMVSHGVLQVPAPSTHSQNTNERQKKSIFFISLPTTNENYSEFRRLFFRASTGRTEPGIVRRRKQVKIYKFFVYLRGA